MFTTAELIVALWFVPVLLYIVLPLAVLAVWSIKRFVDKIGKATLLQRGEFTESGCHSQAAA